MAVIGACTNNYRLLVVIGNVIGFSDSAAKRPASRSNIKLYSGNQPRRVKTGALRGLIRPSR
jgi:hypothetical protein